MILDRLSNVDYYKGLGRKLDRGFAFLTETDFCGLEDGRIEIDGDNVYAILSAGKTKPAADGVWEAHRKYMDIQYVIAGAERMGWAPTEELDPKGEYDPDKDALFLEGVGSFFLVKEGSFAVFGPHDAHMPGLAVAQPALVRKAVVKVKVD